jgi:hypothetical protein
MWQVKNTVVLLLFAALSALLCPHAPAKPRDGTSVSMPSPLTVQEIVSRLEEKNLERAELLRGFEGTRLYRMRYRGFFGSHDAEMTVKLRYTSPDSRQFTLVSESGSKFVCDHVFKSLLDGEQEAMTPENRKRTALSAENYEFTLAGTEGTQEDPRYVLNVVPKGDNKFLYRGKIWVDAKEFVVTRVEAEPAKSPSFWIKKSRISHSYEKVGDFWLPAADNTESWIRFGGRAQLWIEYKDYEITDALQRGDVANQSPSH